MQPVSYSSPSSPRFAVNLLSSLSFIIPLCYASVADDLKHNYQETAPAPKDSPSYLPAQIGGIVGAYALSLVIVASVLLLLAKRRREHLAAADQDISQIPYPFTLPLPPEPKEFPYPFGIGEAPKSPIKNFSYPTPADEDTGPGPSPFVYSPALSTSTLGVNPQVDQRVVAADREMAQQQLEEMYKYVMEQDAAKQAGITLDRPPSAISPVSREPPTPASSQQPRQGILKKGKNKPANLDLERQQEPGKTESRTSSIFSAIMSPKKKKSMKGISISSPIMTPMSGTFPRHEGEEMNAIPPRHYAPASPPPIPNDQAPYARDTRYNSQMAPMTPPDVSPESTMSIDERLGANYGHSRNTSQAPTEADPVSAVSERSNAPLVGLPSSPKPGARFPSGSGSLPSLPASPKPGATFPTSPKPGSSFSRPNAPSAVRTGGALPLRAYEPSLASPSMQTTKQTTFERAAPLSPSGLRTPWTGAPVPYSPYQPFSPVVPITPSLVTKADRKRMKQLQPKTPTVEMVKSSDEVW